MKDIIYTRKYTDQNGVESKEYINVGMLFEKEGRMSIKLKGFIKLSAIQNEKGEVWLNVYEHKPKTKENEQKTAYKGAEQLQVMAEAVNNTSPSQEPKQDEEVPF